MIPTCNLLHIFFRYPLHHWYYSRGIVTALPSAQQLHCNRGRLRIEREQHSRLVQIDRKCYVQQSGNVKSKQSGNVKSKQSGNVKFKHTGNVKFKQTENVNSKQSENVLLSVKLRLMWKSLYGINILTLKACLPGC